MYGGMIGAVIMWGVRRAIYSSEAGTGSGAQASAAAEVSHPVKQGLAQGFSVYVDTLFVCTITGLMILSTNSYNVAGPDGQLIVQYAPPSSRRRAPPTRRPRSTASSRVRLGVRRRRDVLLRVHDAAVVRLLRRHEHRLPREVAPHGAPRQHRLQLVLAGSILLGSFRSSDFAWALADVGIGLYTWINLIALVFLSPKAVAVLKDYERQRRAGQDPVFDPTAIGIMNARRSGTTSPRVTRAWRAGRR